MTPEQIDAFTNGLIHLHDAAATYGPGIGITLAGAGALWGLERIWRRTETRRDINRGIRRLNQYANHPGSRPILDDFHQPRKEKPQP